MFKASGEHRRGERLEVGRACEVDVYAFELARRVDQERRRPAPARGGKRDLSTQQLRGGPLELVRRTRLRYRKEPQRRIERAGVEIRSCRGERSVRPSRGVTG